MNNFTKYLTFAVDFLFIKQPALTSIGIIFGAATKYIITILAVWIVALQVLVAEDVPIWGYMLIGIAVFHSPTAIRIMFGKYSHLSENEEKVLGMIRELKIPDFQKQAMYLKLVEKVLEKTELNPELQSEIKNILE